MSRAFLVPILLPADPTTALQAATKQYVDTMAGNASSPGNVLAFGFNASTTEPPTGNQLRLNNATQTAATLVWVSETTWDGLDVAVGLSRILAGYQVYLQDFNDSTKWLLFDVSGAGTDKGTYWEIPIVYNSGPGGLPAAKMAMQSIGPASHGIPSGGADGDVLTKTASTNYAVAWEAPTGGGGAPVGTKLTALTTLTGANAVNADLIEVVDVSDTTMAASGTNKKMTLAEYRTYIGRQGLFFSTTNDDYFFLDPSSRTITFHDANTDTTLISLQTQANGDASSYTTVEVRNGDGSNRVLIRAAESQVYIDLIGSAAYRINGHTAVTDPGATPTNTKYLRDDGTWQTPASGTPAADSVDNTILANMAQSTIKGRAAGAGTGDPVDLTTAAQAKTILAIASTDVSGLGSLATKSTIASADITDGVVSNTDLTTMPTLTLKGNSTGSTAAPTDLTVAQTLTMLGTGGSGNLQRFTFSTTTTAPPAAATIRFNNATLASVTQIFVHYTSVDDTDIKTRMLQKTFGERLYVQDKNASGNYAIFRLTAAPTDNTTYATLTVAFESSAGTITNGQDVLAGFINENRLVSINTQTGTTYTVLSSDIYKTITLNNAAAITVNLPTNATTPFPIGATIDLVQLGAGQVTVASPGTPTVNATPSRQLRAQYSAATLIKYATDTWLLVGDLA